jgi:hypothetical protein
LVGTASSAGHDTHRKVMESFKIVRVNGHAMLLSCSDQYEG